MTNTDMINADTQQDDITTDLQFKATIKMLRNEAVNIIRRNNDPEKMIQEINDWAKDIAEIEVHDDWDTAQTRQS